MDSPPVQGILARSGAGPRGIAGAIEDSHAEYVPGIAVTWYYVSWYAWGV